jgi:hypothetical protein
MAGLALAVLIARRRRRRARDPVEKAVETTARTTGQWQAILLRAGQAAGTAAGAALAKGILSRIR